MASLNGRVVASTLVAAYFGNLALRQPAANTLAMSLFILFSAVAVYATGNIRSRSSQSMLAGAVLFGAFLTLRTEPRLVVFDLVASLILLVGAATFGRGGSPWNLGPIQVLVEAMDAIQAWLRLPIDAIATKLVPPETDNASTSVSVFASTAPRPQPRPPSRLAAMVRGLVMASPVVFVLGRLLSAADPVFASFVSLDLGLFETLGVQAVLSALSGWAVMAVQRKSSRDTRINLHNPSRFSIGKSEAMIVLSSVNLLFAVFAISQIYALSGAGDRIIAQAEMTAKSYARQGFFQLLWVAGLTLLLLMILWALRPERTALGDTNAASASIPRDGVLWLSYLSFVLTMGIVAVAVARLMIYIEDGQTPLRFYSTVFSIWIAVAFILVLIRISGVRLSNAWLTPALLLSGLTTLAILNLANPEAIIASYNLARYQAGVEHPNYRGDDPFLAIRLTHDGHQVLIKGVESVPLLQQASMRSSFCVHSPEDTDRGWWGFNLSESNYDKAKEQFCR